MVDYTGGSAFGTWLEENVTDALVFTEKAGVNSVVIDSAPDLKGVFRNLSVSTSMYSGQMCTTPQNIYIPRDGIEVGDERVSFDEVAGGLLRRSAGCWATTQGQRHSRLDQGDRYVASHRRSIGRRRGAARVTSRCQPVLSRRGRAQPGDRQGRRRRPGDLHARDVWSGHLRDRHRSTDQSLELATESAKTHGAITWLVYSTDDGVIDAAEEAAVDAGVSVAFNLMGGLFVNQSAAFSDFHVTGANPAGNASLTDPAFVAGRFRIIGVRKPVT